MRKVGRGRLAGISSVAGMRGIPGAGAYSASKAAAITYLEALRVELRPSGVKVVTVCPGYVATPMTAVEQVPHALHPSRRRRRASPLIDQGRRYAVVPADGARRPRHEAPAQRGMTASSSAPGASRAG
ncbi:MAG: SDR family NAD(P)-dependent oxidoreductase [Rhodocyclaceae bacterium]|nr:SDR family NAD(P)-dependent oxidoreductase [Rhodocyclaceae bacterium]